MLQLVCVLLVMGGAHAGTPAWRTANMAGVDVNFQSATSSELGQLSQVLQRAVPQVLRLTGHELCAEPVVYVHPDLASFQAASGAAWFQLAVADRAACRIDVQRLAVVAQHGGLERMLRHELFHLAQPDGWERWRAEGAAQQFAGERPAAPPLGGLSPAQLDLMLAAPADELTYRRAMATALEWVRQGR